MVPGGYAVSCLWLQFGFRGYCLAMMSTPYKRNAPTMDNSITYAD